MPFVLAIKTLTLLTAALLLPLQARAQDAAQPDAAVPGVLYRSVFKDTPQGVETGSADWKKANQEVGQFLRGHVDLLKWEAQQAVPPVKPNRPATDVQPAQDATKTVAPLQHKH